MKITHNETTYNVPAEAFELIACLLEQKRICILGGKISAENASDSTAVFAMTVKITEVV